jgi:hypothetical protein
LNNISAKYSILIYIQQDATLHSLFSLETAPHVSGVTSTHHQERKYILIYPTRCNVTQFILSGNCSTCFGCYFHPSSGAQIYSNIYPTRCNVTRFILSGNCSTCFGCYFHPPSGAQIYSNIYPTRCNVTQFILSGNCSTCFGCYFHSSSGAQTTVSTASGICQTVTATCRHSGR